MRRVMRSLPLLALLVLAAPALAHVGSPNVLFDGDAGPYPVRVIVRPPAVIPADAEITVRLRDGAKADEVLIQPVLFDAGFLGAPPPDAAKPVPGAPGVWTGQFLLMKDGSWNVRVTVRGPAGEGTTEVPMPAVRSQVFPMEKSLGTILVALGLFLFAGAVTIVGAAVREASLPPGEKAGPRRRLWARVATGLAAVFLALVVWGGKGWWDSTDAQLRQKLFKPFDLRTTARLTDGRPLLALSIEDPGSGYWSPLIPDHGKLMHMFLLREPGLDAFAHLHPLAQGQKDFLAALPPLPAGSYRVYADIVDENGFPQTLVSRVQLPPKETGGEPGETLPALDPDDSWRTSEPLTAAPAEVSRLEDGGTMLWRREPLKAGEETTLRFEVRGADGRPASLEPYMGMRSHAVITRDDGEVFVHLHPMGTVNMAAQEVFAAKEGAHAGMSHAAMAMGDANVLSFPYEFPKPGRYRLWVQAKSQGRVLTGVFVTEVAK